jgi:hypothetical protein
LRYAVYMAKDVFVHGTVEFGNRLHFRQILFVLLGELVDSLVL